MSTNEQLAQALRLQHEDRLRHSISQRKSNATCGSATTGTLRSLLESAYLQSEMGKLTVFALAAHESCAKACEAEKAAPTLCRVRTRIKRTGYTLVGTTDYPWTAWAECSPESADEFERSKDPQWEYEVQRLYTAAPAAPASVSEAPVAVPLTDEEKHKMWLDANHRWCDVYSWYLQGIEDAERTLAARWGVKLEGGE